MKSVFVLIMISAVFAANSDTVSSEVDSPEIGEPVSNTMSKQNEPLILHGRLSAVGFRDDANQVEFETPLIGRFYAKVPIVKKLRRILTTGDKTLKAFVDGFATVNGKMNARLCEKSKESDKERETRSNSQDHEVEVKLDLAIATLNPKQLDFNWLYVGTAAFSESDLAGLSDAGVFQINGEVTFFLDEANRKKRTPFSGSGYFFD